MFKSLTILILPRPALGHLNPSIGLTKELLNRGHNVVFVINQTFKEMLALGHLNPSIGLAEELRSRGHNIVFVINQAFKEMLDKYGFKVEVMKTKMENDNQDQADISISTLFLKSGILSSLSSIEKMKILMKSIVKPYIEENPESVVDTLSILNEHKPDILIFDQPYLHSTLINTGKPWINICVTNPLVIDNEMTPPASSGYPTDGDRNAWIEFRELQLFSEYIGKTGMESPFLNIYNYPKELDYTDIRPLPHNWFAVDSFIRKGEEQFELPVQLKGWKGKLIYFSLGSIGSVNIELMKRLVNILSKRKHKFIVSKGLFGDKYELADNMWGKKFVPQTKVLPLVDLVLTHGGNNTIIETLYFGKPMIVLPLFGDHFDNAQRINEKGFGVRIDPYLCSEEELLKAIEMLLNDNELKQKLSFVSKRIQTSDSLKKAVDKIESLVK